MIAVLGAALAALGAPAAAMATTQAQEEAQGARVFQELQRGDRTCKQVSDTQFERVGEYVMGRMMGNAHAAMNRMLKARLGTRGEEQVHIAMGKRWTGCDPNARFPAGAGAMMGGGMMGGGGSGGMMGQGGSPGGGGMMGSGGGSTFTDRTGSGGDGWSTAEVLVVIGMGLLLVVAVIVVVLLARGRGTGRGRALQVLQERYARGEVSDEEFRRARDALAGGT